MTEGEPQPRRLVLIEANWQAKPLVTLLQTTPAVSRAVEFRQVEQRAELDALLARDEPGRSRLMEVWQQVTDFWKPELWESRPALPDGARLVRFPVFDGHCFWPLAGSDPRNRSEPPFYPDGRYRFSDKVAARLADHPGDDAALYETYLRQSAAAIGDADTRLIAEIARMAGRDALCDIAFTLFFLENYRRLRLFHAPGAPAGPVYRWLGMRLIESMAPRIGADAATLGAAVARQALGLQGIAQFQCPVHPLVANDLALSWALPETRTRFGKNEWSHRTAMLRAIRWQGWTP